MEEMGKRNAKYLQRRRLRIRFRSAAVVLYFSLGMQSQPVVRAQVSATSAPVSTSPASTLIPTTVGRSPAPNPIVTTPTPVAVTPSPSSRSPTNVTTAPVATSVPTSHPSTVAPVATTAAPTRITSAPVVTTKVPSAAPTVAATTSTPTIAPVVPPTLKPTKPPTKHPTISPTKAPLASTNSPTVATPSPTFIITPAPTTRTSAPTTKSIPPSKQPTISPSASPTNTSVTLAPTSQPSKTGTRPSQPTSKPLKPTTFKPSRTVQTTRPTSHANSTTETPTVLSHAPTAAPTPSSNVQPAVSVVMLLENTTSILVGTTFQSWISVTVSFLLQSVQPPLPNLTVALNVTNQRLVLTGNRLRRLQQQQLQSPSVPLQISFVTFLSYESASTTKPETLVGQAYNSVAKRAAYVKMLQRTNDPTFANVGNVQVLVDGSIPAEEDIPTVQPTTKSKFPTAIVAGAAGAGAFLLIVLVGIFVFCRDKKKQKQGKAFSHDPTPTTITGPDRLPMSTEIVMESQDDISTLGDPMFPGAGGMLMNGLDRDENTASITDDYDYARQYRMEQHLPSESSLTRDRFESVDDSAKDSSDLSKLGLGKMSESFFSDDASFEEQFVDPDEQFEVLAPAGKLGMVIDTPSGGAPMVHAIKESSVLADTVHVGDKLISVDGEPTIHMTAMQVSKLISLKANNSTRTLVFLRSRSTNGTAIAQ